MAERITAPNPLFTLSIVLTDFLFLDLWDLLVDLAGQEGLY